MSKKRTFFSKSRLYPVFFMIIITIFFIGILATFYQLTFNRVQIYKQTQLQLTILELFDLPSNNSDEEFNKFITEVETDKAVYYKAKKDSIILGYCFPISGKGLWGTIDALIALSPDLKVIQKMEIIDQNETPGLGGRITESWFKDQFKDKIIVIDGVVKKFQLISEGSNVSENEIQQVTGATASSKAVVDMIYKNVKKIVKREL